MFSRLIRRAIYILGTVKAVCAFHLWWQVWQPVPKQASLCLDLYALLPDFPIRQSYTHTFLWCRIHHNFCRTNSIKIVGVWNDYIHNTYIKCVINNENEGEWWYFAWVFHNSLCVKAMQRVMLFSWWLYSIVLLVKCTSTHWAHKWVFYTWC